MTAVTPAERTGLLEQARKAGRAAAAQHKAHGTIPGPPPPLFSGPLLSRQAATAWHDGFGESRPALPPGGPAVRIAKVGPKGYIHGWIFVGAPGVGDKVHHPAHGEGKITAVAHDHVTARFAGGEHSFARRPAASGESKGLQPHGPITSLDAWKPHETELLNLHRAERSAGTDARQDKTLERIAAIQGFDAKPSEGPLDPGREILHRGFGGRYTQAGEGQGYAEQFRHGAYFGGTGIKGNGTYVSTDAAQAEGYGDTVRMQLRPHARTISQAGIENKLDQVPDGPLREIVDGDPGRLAAMLGYDAIRTPGSKKRIILNRGALQVEGHAPDRAEASPHEAVSRNLQRFTGTVSPGPLQDTVVPHFARRLEQMGGKLRKKADRERWASDKGVQFTRYALDKSSHMPGTKVLTALDEHGQLAGALSYYEHADESIGKTVLHVDYLGTTGTAAGAGTALAHKVAQIAAEKGLPVLGEPENEGALTFWTKMGWTQDPTGDGADVFYGWTADQAREVARVT